jgi:hypothetical protein
MVSVDQTLADLDVALVNQHTGLVDALGLETLLVDAGLETLVQELVDGKTEHVIELEFFIGEETIAVHAVEESSSFEESSGVLFLKGEQLTCSLSELGEEEMNSPDFTLVLETILADQLQFAVDTFLFEGTTRGLKGCRV